MSLQNQITVATVADLHVNILELSSRVDNVTALVEGMVGSQTQLTMASVFGRLVDPATTRALESEIKPYSRW